MSGKFIQYCMSRLENYNNKDDLLHMSRVACTLAQQDVSDMWKYYMDPHSVTDFAPPPEPKVSNKTMVKVKHKNKKST